MSNSNEQLILKIRGISENLPKIVEQVGSMLVRNIRSSARIRLKEVHKYPFEFQNDFQKPSTVYYNSAEKAVFVDHPATFRLEYGFGDLTITPKNGEFLRFIGQDGEEVFVKEVTIKATKPLNFIRSAIKETSGDVAKKFKEVMSE